MDRPAPTAAAPASLATLGRNVLRGSTNWKGLIPTNSNDVLNHELRKMLVMYGEMAEVTYDGFIANLWSRDFGKPHLRPTKLLDQCLLKDSEARRYKIDVTDPNDERFYIYATDGAYKLDDSYCNQWEGLQVFRKNWIGYVAISEPGADGLRDIAVAFRGTITKGEWETNFLGDNLEDITEGMSSDGKVHDGFRKSYFFDPPKELDTDRPAAAVIVWEAIKELLARYPGEIGSITTTGHSLGGALATLSAFDIGKRVKGETREGMHGSQPHVSAITFASPRVGNPAFNNALLDTYGVKVLRVVNTSDVVPLVPGLLPTITVKVAQALRVDLEAPSTTSVLRWLSEAASYAPFINDWNYAHPGVKVEVETELIEAGKEPSTNSSPRPLRKLERKDAGPRHNLEVYLYMVATQKANNNEPPLERDPVLMNKGDNCLSPEWQALQEVQVPPNWWQPLIGDYYYKFSPYRR